MRAITNFTPDDLLQPGKLQVLIGPNGSGKTTLAKQLARENKGVFLGFQEVVSIPGVTYRDVLELTAKDKLAFPESFLDREIGIGLSGGERRLAEVYQALAIQPKYAIFDEPDAGVDAENLEIIVQSLEILRRKGTGILVITHNQKFLQLLKPDKVYVKPKGH